MSCLMTQRDNDSLTICLSSDLQTDPSICPLLRFLISFPLSLFPQPFWHCWLMCAGRRRRTGGCRIRHCTPEQGIARGSLLGRSRWPQWWPGSSPVCPSGGARNTSSWSSAPPGARLRSEKQAGCTVSLHAAHINTLTLHSLPCDDRHLRQLPRSLSSVTILLVWFHVLSMTTTLLRGHALDSEAWAPSGAADPGSGASCVAPRVSSVLCLFGDGSQSKLSLRSCTKSCIGTDPGPGKTKTTYRGKTHDGTAG